MNIGDRVGAIAGQSNDGKLEVFGYGTFQGEDVPTDDVIFMGLPYSKYGGGLKNPKIQLDNGDIVYGCECWWGPEEEIKAQIKLYFDEGTITEVTEITIAEYRAKAKKAATADLN